MKKILFLLGIAVLALTGCSKESESTSSTLTVDFTISKNPCLAQEEVTFTAKLSGGKSPYTCSWSIGSLTTLSGETASYTFESNGTFVVKLEVKDASGNTATRQKNLVVNPAAIAETDNIALNWASKIDGYTSVSSVAIADDGSIYATSRARKLYKFNANGEKQWEKEVYSTTNTSSVLLSIPSIDTDGTIYIGGGSAKPDGVYVAFNPDGSVKWRFTDFYTTSTKEPAVGAILAGIGDSHIYIGNNGVTGSILSINKTDGTRAGFCKHGSGGPVGGAKSGVAISNKGTLHWYGGEYGAFGMSASSLDIGTAGADFIWQTYGDKTPEYAKIAPICPITITTVSGKSAMVGMVTDQVGTRVYALDVENGTEISSTYIEDTEEQDQGGVVITKEGYAVASLCYTLGQDNGGIALIDLAKGKVLARYRVQEKLSGSAAIDAAGNIHFASEAGFYYIVKYDGTNFKLLAKVDLARLVREDSRYASTFSELYSGKIWNSIVIGDDGKMYCVVTDDDTRAFGAVVCLGFDGCTAPGNTEWPMMGHDRRHTNVQD